MEELAELVPPLWPVGPLEGRVLSGASLFHLSSARPSGQWMSREIAEWTSAPSEEDDVRGWEGGGGPRGPAAEI